MIFEQGAFQIDPNLTPEEVKARRQRMAWRRPRYGDADTVGEGLGQLFTGISEGVQSYGLNKAERAGREGATSLFDSLINGRQEPDTAATGGPLSILGVQPQQSTPSGASADLIRAGLIERGLPEHVADGFLMNFQDESGLNPGINERNPIVPGSRGGFGLAQWTGPRRKQLEAYAESVGRPVSDTDVQLDFLMQELGSSESAAARNILSTQDAGGAAAAIVNDFLRPAEEHRERRVAEYTGGQPQQDNSQLYQALNNPWLTPSQRGTIEKMIQQREQASDPLRQMQIEKGQLEIEQMRNPRVDPTTSQRDYEFYRNQELQQGRNPLSFNDWSLQDEKASAPSVSNVINTGDPVDSRPLVDKPEKGFQRRWDADKRSWVDEPIPGSAADVESGEAAEADKAKKSAQDTAGEVVVTAASRAREAARSRAVGGPVGALASFNPYSDNAEVYRQVSSLQSIASAESLNAMRRQSKTGGALGNVTEKELVLLRQQSGALDPASPNFLRDLDDYERNVLRVIHGKEAGDRIFEQSRQGNVFPDFSGMSASQIGDFMQANPSKNWTPEQRAAVAARLRELQQ